MRVSIELDTSNDQDVIYLSNLLGTNTAPAFTHQLGSVEVGETEVSLATTPTKTQAQQDSADTFGPPSEWSEPKAEAPKRKRRTKAEMEADKAALEEAAKLPDDERAEAAEVSDTDDFSTRLEAAKERASALVASDRVHLVRDALAAAGDVKRVTLLDESNLGLFIEALDKADAESDDVV